MEAVRYSTSTGIGVILDRSVFSDWVFAERGRLDENISPDGFMHYMKLRESMLEKLPKPDVVVYVDVPPEECYKRIAIRARDCESSLPLAYLEGLHECYEKLMYNMQNEGVRVIRLDWNNFGDTKTVVNLINTSLMSVSGYKQNEFLFNDREVANMLKLSQGDDNYTFDSNMENRAEAKRDHTFRDVDSVELNWLLNFKRLNIMGVE